MSIHIIYIPGLGDSYDGFRRFALRLWQRADVHVELLPMTWYDGKSFEVKYAKIQTRINQLQADNKQIVLVGESAGASIALIAAARNPAVTHVLTLCGVAQPNTPIAQSLRKRAPALDGAVTLLANVNTRVPPKRTSVRARIDNVINKRYSVAPNAQEHVIWSVSHLPTIVLCLTVFSPYLLKLIRR